MSPNLALFLLTCSSSLDPPLKLFSVFCFSFHTTSQVSPAVGTVLDFYMELFPFRILPRILFGFFQVAPNSSAPNNFKCSWPSFLCFCCQSVDHLLSQRTPCSHTVYIFCLSLQNARIFLPFMEYVS